MDSIQCTSSIDIMSTISSNTTDNDVIVVNIQDVSRQQFHQKKRKSSLKSTRTRNNNSNVSSTSDEMKKQSIGGGDDVVEKENNNSNNKSVRFSIVEIRDYNLCLGDNPSVSRGVPISLDWDYDTEHSHEFEEYESDRIVDRRTAPNEMKRPSLQRVQLLKGLGYSRNEINEQAKCIHRIQEQRLNTRRKVERNEHIQLFFNRIVHCFPSNKKMHHHDADASSTSTSASSSSSTSTSSLSSTISLRLKSARKRVDFFSFKQHNDSVKFLPGDNKVFRDDDETLASSTSSTKSEMILATEESDI